jgi:hypothetical protein
LFSGAQKGNLVACAPLVAVRALLFFGDCSGFAREGYSFSKRSWRDALRPERVIT